MRPVIALIVFTLLSLAFESAPADEMKAAHRQPLLSGTYWWVEDIDGQGVVDRSHTTLGFLDDNRLGGDGACNRFTGSYRQDEDRLEFGPLASTRRACPAAIMDQDSRFHAALARVERFRLEPSGLLHLLDENGTTVIRAFAIGSDEL